VPPDVRKGFAFPLAIEEIFVGYAARVEVIASIKFENA